jgi:hypothetical protein
MKRSKQNSRPHGPGEYRSTAPAAGRKRTRRNVLGLGFGALLAAAGVGGIVEADRRQRSPAYDPQTEQALGNTIRPTMQSLAAQIHGLFEANPDAFLRTTTEEGRVRLQVSASAEYDQSSSLDVVLGTTPDGRPDPRNVFFVDVSAATTPDRGAGYVNLAMFAAPGGERYAGEARPVAGRNVGWLAYGANISSIDGHAESLLSGILDTSSRHSWADRLPGGADSPLPTARHIADNAQRVMDRAVQIAFPAR